MTPPMARRHARLLHRRLVARPRDRFIGSATETRGRNPHLVIDNTQFLILPWVRIPNPVSHILSLFCQSLHGDWSGRYSTTPGQIGTFVETPRHMGTVYQASGWVNLELTQGRGRYDRYRQFDKPGKAIGLKPLCKDWKRTLNG